mmetsp:Transcript_5175/g.9251  ORF Transcript_5175/g.9251 Transcript_5175/m.9251 type:complete len:237 (+) Transcript_5175:148-858(+)
MQQTRQSSSRTLSASLLLCSVVAAFTLGGLPAVRGDSQKKVEGPFVQVHKDFDVYEGTVGKEMIFNVEIHNMGTGDAFNVDFTDDAISSENGKSFTLKDGSFKNHFDKIEAGDYVSFKQVLIPLAPGPMLIPSSIVTYTAAKNGGKKTSVVGSVDGFQVMTTTQSHVRTLLKMGKYATFGFCKTLNDWIRFAVFAAIAAAFILSKSTFSKVKKVQDARKRTLARRALGVEDIMKDE